LVVFGVFCVHHRLARQHAAERGLSNLSYLNPQDGPESCLPCSPTFHLVVVQDSLHDMSAPQEALKVCGDTGKAEAGHAEFEPAAY
jgi:hypothetical protein